MLSRRHFLQTGVSLLAFVGARPLLAAPAVDAPDVMTGAGRSAALRFAEVERGITKSHRVAADYRVQKLVSWGDAVKPTSDFNPLLLDAGEQAKRVGYNCDFTAFLPYPYGSNSSQRGLLHVNHEYTDAALMFAGVGHGELSESQVRVEQEAHGFTVLEIQHEKGEWKQVLGGYCNRRVTGTTPIALSGPVAGHERMRTVGDPAGKIVLGTLGNCAGGVTPWGTVLVSEENFDTFFYGQSNGAEAANHTRYSVAKYNEYQWYKFDERFDVNQTPNEPNRFGWVVEYDPYDPHSVPLKRTALGRFKHETATCVLAEDGRVVVYSGDDGYDEYIYRFVSRDKVDTNDRNANRTLLDHGVLSVAKFHEDGRLEWIPLQHGRRGLTAKNGFASQADVLIEARRAGDVVGATAMDRPEGIAIHPLSGEVYVSLTKNPKRETANSANPRIHNKAGHIVKIQPPGKGSHGADQFHWEFFILAGDPNEDSPRYGGRPSTKGWFGCPDNLVFDEAGHLWVATDGMQKPYKTANGLFAVPTQGEKSGVPKAFFRVPVGAEVTGPSFTPDGTTLFVSVQHPGEGSLFEKPSTRWPDFDSALPPRPTVVAIRHRQGQKIGT